MIRVQTIFGDCEPAEAEDKENSLLQRARQSFPVREHVGAMRQLSGDDHISTKPIEFMLLL